jgi:hypothetical protein
MEDPVIAVVTIVVPDIVVGIFHSGFGYLAFTARHAATYASICAASPFTTASR